MQEVNEAVETDITERPEGKNRSERKMSWEGREKQNSKRRWDRPVNTAFPELSEGSEISLPRVTPVGEQKAKARILK
jgi:hypothetical protein